MSQLTKYLRIKDLSPDAIMACKDGFRLPEVEYVEYIKKKYGLSEDQRVLADFSRARVLHGIIPRADVSLLVKCNDKLFVDLSAKKEVNSKRFMNSLICNARVFRGNDNLNNLEKYVFQNDDLGKDNKNLLKRMEHVGKSSHDNKKIISKLHRKNDVWHQKNDSDFLIHSGRKNDGRSACIVSKCLEVMIAQLARSFCGECVAKTRLLAPSNKNDFYLSKIIAKDIPDNKSHDTLANLLALSPSVKNIDIKLNVVTEEVIKIILFDVIVGRLDGSINMILDEDNLTYLTYDYGLHATTPKYEDVEARHVKVAHNLALIPLCFLIFSISCLPSIKDRIYYMDFLKKTVCELVDINFEKLFMTTEFSCYMKDMDVPDDKYISNSVKMTLNTSVKYGKMLLKSFISSVSPKYFLLNKDKSGFIINRNTINGLTNVYDENVDVESIYDMIVHRSLDYLSRCNRKSPISTKLKNVVKNNSIPTCVAFSLFLVSLAMMVLTILMLHCDMLCEVRSFNVIIALITSIVVSLMVSSVIVLFSKFSLDYMGYDDRLTYLTEYNDLDDIIPCENEVGECENEDRDL